MTSEQYPQPGTDAALRDSTGFGATLPDAVPAYAACAACGAVLMGGYCHACGQKAALPERFSLRYLAGEFLSELTSLDGKLWSTARLLVTRPGQLVVDYLEGRGSLHLTPVKLYLIATAIYFVLFPYAVFTDTEVDRITSQLQLPQTEAWLQQFRARIESGAFYQSYQSWYTGLLAATVMLNALVLKLAFRHRLIGEHLVFALNELAFIFLLTIPLFLMRRVFEVDTTGMLILLLMIGAWLAYVGIAIHRVYRPRRRTLVAFLIAYTCFREVVDASVAMLAIFLAAR